MRLLILLCALISSWAYSQDDFSARLAEIERNRENSLYQWRIQNRFNEGSLTPAEKVASFKEHFTRVHQESLALELRLHEESCTRNQTNCLTPAQRASEEAKVRIAIGHLERKISWVSTNAQASASEREMAFKEEDRQRDIDICAQGGECEGLNSTDRGLASERSQRPSVVTPPIVTPPEEIVVTPEETTPENVVTNNDPTVGLAKIEADLALLESEFNTTHPAFRDKALTEEVKNFLVGLEAQRLEKTIAMHRELCERTPSNAEYCLTEEQIAQKTDQSKSAACKIERKFKDSSLDLGRHDSQWSALPEPRSCEALLNGGAVVTPDSTPVPAVVVTPSENVDENSPRNYKPETCKWVQDLPRKIVNGPGCTTKGRSKMCTGYVVCEQKEGGGKFVRMSTCGADKCGNRDIDAVNCTKDQYYFSTRPIDESKHFVSPKLKQILTGEQ